MPFLVGNDEYVEVTGVVDADTGDEIASGTGTAQFYADDQADNSLAQTGDTITNATVGSSFSLTYDADDDTWRGTKPSDLALANGSRYWLVVTIADGSGGNGSWVIYDVAKVRQQTI